MTRVTEIMQSKRAESNWHKVVRVEPCVTDGYITIVQRNGQRCDVPLYEVRKVHGVNLYWTGTLETQALMRRLQNEGFNVRMNWDSVLGEWRADVWKPGNVKTAFFISEALPDALYRAYERYGES